MTADISYLTSEHRRVLSAVPGSGAGRADRHGDIIAASGLEYSYAVQLLSFLVSLGLVEKRIYSRDALYFRTPDGDREARRTA